MTILIADDERTIREGLAHSIDWESLGIHTVLQAADGREADRLIRTCRPDIAILDIIMPEMTGIELVESYKDNPSAPKFMLLSGYSEFDYARKAMRGGVVDYLLKPCGVDEITAAVAGIIQKIDRAREEQAAFLNSLELLEPGARLGLLRSYGDVLPETAARKEESYSQPVRRVLEYIADHLSDPELSLNHIAREVLFLNADYLGKLFKREVGERFSNVLMSMRMAEAMRLLSQSGEKMRIYEVAAEVGLGANVTYFSQAFKKITGVLPTQFSKNAGQ